MEKFSDAYVVGDGRVALQCEQILNDHFDNVKLIKVDELNNKDDFFNAIKGALIISANNLYIFKPPCVKNNFIINYHNSLLPAHRGVNAHVWAIFCGDEIAGITWHRVDCGIDTGEILIQKEIKINQMSACELLLAQHKMAVLAFDELIKNRLKKIKNASSFNARSELHKKSDLPNNAELNLSWNFDKKQRFLRAFNVGVFRQIPYAKVKYKGKMLEIIYYEIDNKSINLTLKNGEILRLKEQK
ncbi:formyltransferase family protein [Campylobacter mucosalis]|uniref:phosphoribosylglycinamide formyltransferase 1 n=1 Tax=Campylobacter mucosalis CCUG 21559 TaxID=1032067 RepID=A0A6G5QG60_9BACT|nr:formyltransferase family protein [Campylobacter mucosalis]QCD44604.1 formyltransferase domain-containing protein [Campylobacter mucosalis CCUG 21559]